MLQRGKVRKCTYARALIVVGLGANVGRRTVVQVTLTGREADDDTASGRDEYFDQKIQKTLRNS